MIGRSATFLETLRLVDRIARYDAPVLIEGETGTGKEVAARAIHYKGPRSGKPFVPINCGAIPDALIENEFFGHRKGAYTDARGDSRGLFHLAEGGTVLLDEVDALSNKGQVTLLRFLQDYTFRPLGASREHVADVRIIAASNRNLARLVEAGEFRLDLYYRLKLMFMELPPLRARQGDPELLVTHFLKRCGAKYGDARKQLSSSTLAWFHDYAWPGNVRELENLVCREFLLSDELELNIPAPTSFSFSLNGEVTSARDSEQMPYKEAKARAMEEFARRFLQDIMRRANGNVTLAAKLAKKERRALGKLLKKYGIESTQFRDTQSQFP